MRSKTRLIWLLCKQTYSRRICNSFVDYKILHIQPPLLWFLWLTTQTLNIYIVQSHALFLQRKSSILNRFFQIYNIIAASGNGRGLRKLFDIKILIYAGV